jgi:hypothetical protein
MPNRLPWVTPNNNKNLAKNLRPTFYPKKTGKRLAADDE